MPVKKYQPPELFKVKDKVQALVTAAGPEKPTATSMDITPVPGVASQPPAKRYKREELLAHWAELSGRSMNWLLEGTRLETMLAESKPKDIAVMLGIATEKVLLLEGQPTQIIGQPQQQKLDQLGQALQVALQQRGLAKNVTLTERTATINLNEPGTP